MIPAGPPALQCFRQRARIEPRVPHAFAPLRGCALALRRQAGRRLGTREPLQVVRRATTRLRAGDEHELAAHLRQRCLEGSGAVRVRQDHHLRFDGPVRGWAPGGRHALERADARRYQIDVVDPALPSAPGAVLLLVRLDAPFRVFRQRPVVGAGHGGRAGQARPDRVHHRLAEFVDLRAVDALLPYGPDHRVVGREGLSGRRPRAHRCKRNRHGGEERENTGDYNSNRGPHGLLRDREWTCRTRYYRVHTAPGHWTWDALRPCGMQPDTERGPPPHDDTLRSTSRKTADAHDEQGLVAEPVEPEASRAPCPLDRPHGRGFRLRRGVQVARPGGPEEGPVRADDHVAGLVAGRLRPLRPALHPHGVAQRGHIPHQRRPRRRRGRHPALRAPQQLARQRPPGQGAPAALAHQAEVRPQALLGRPDDLRGQLRPGVDGLQDDGLRRRPRGRVGARGHRLGRRGHLARGRALQRRPRTRRALRRGADGPHLRESRRAQRQAGSRRGGAGHPRDLPAHGDERRGDGRAHSRRTHLRQGARRRRRGPLRGSGAGGRRPGGAGSRLEDQLRHRQGRRFRHQRHRGRLDDQPGEVGQQLPGEPARLRVGAGEEPRRRGAVDPEGRRGRSARCRMPTIRRRRTLP